MPCSEPTMHGTTAWLNTSSFDPDAKKARHAPLHLSASREQGADAVEGCGEQDCTLVACDEAELSEVGDLDELLRALQEGSLASWQARRLVLHIEQRLDTALPLSELAQVVCLSKSYFSRAFRRSFGTSPHEYIIQRRIKRAQAEMLNSAQPLSQIALSCGFTDQSHFSRLFRRFVGSPPFAWRRTRLSRNSMLQC